ncbi:MAG: helix-hairpin-helix domain-containing protein [Candidatus Nealsonbacteria bacterium]
MKTLVFVFSLLSLLLVNFVFAAEKIDINSAPLEDLIKIMHIGEVRARELISLRPFSSLNDLTRIKGIGEERVKDIKSQGLAWIGVPGAGTDVGGRASNVLEASPPTSELQTSNVFGAAASVPAQKLPLPLLVACVLAVFSGIIILILKKKIN